MEVSDFDFELPPELIAQAPPPERTAARLLVLNRATGEQEHTGVSALPDLLCPGDLLVVNNTRVFPARLLGRRVPSGGGVECLLLGRLDHDRWDALVHPGQKLRPGGRLVFQRSGRVLHGEIVDRKFFGRRIVKLWTEDEADIEEAVDAIGHVPLPPYIRREDVDEDRERYQTVYARQRGSVAAPTAGLHFSPALLDRLKSAGIEIAEITLDVGYGTFQPVRAERVEDHVVDPEPFTIGADAATALNSALNEGRRIIAVGTTTTRALEAGARSGGGLLRPESARTDLFIYPGFQFRVVGGLLTNFHLPRSSLLMLVSAFAGRELVLDAYRHAVERRYRFYSYGDAMLIL